MPKQFAAPQAESVESTHPDEVLDGRPLQRCRGTAQEVRKREERPFRLACFDDLPGDVLTPSTHESQTYPQIVPLGGAADIASVDVGQQDLDTITAGIPAEYVQRVEAHRLVVEQGHVVFGGEVMP